MKTPLRFSALLAALCATVVLSVSTYAGDNPAAEPKLRNDWLDRHNGFVEEAHAGGIDLLFIGDSITDGWRTRGKEIWAQRYAPLHAANFGISGDKTEHVLWRLQNGELDGIHPKVAVLMIGTNNTKRDTVPQIAEGITAIVREIQKHTPDTKVLLLAIFPRAPQPDAPVRQKIAEINKLIAQLDDGQHVFYLDIGAKFLEPDGTLSPEIMPDALHPNEAGYKIWADAMADKLAELLK
jgi:lysophospholipase L1-like esterase